MLCPNYSSTLPYFWFHVWNKCCEFFLRRDQKINFINLSYCHTNKFSNSNTFNKGAVYCTIKRAPPVIAGAKYG